MTTSHRESSELSVQHAPCQACELHTAYVRRTRCLLRCWSTLIGVRSVAGQVPRRNMTDLGKGPARQTGEALLTRDNAILLAVWHVMGLYQGPWASIEAASTLAATQDRQAPSAGVEAGSGTSDTAWPGGQAPCHRRAAQKEASRCC